MPIELSDRQRRLLDAVLILGVVALAFVVVGDVASVFGFFSDVLLVFFLAWLLAFAILPLINLVKRLVPGIPDLAAVIFVYLVVVGLLVGVIVQLSAALAPSLSQIATDDKGLKLQLRELMQGLQDRLVSLGFNVNLVSQTDAIWKNLQDWAGQAGGALQDVAVTSVGVLGNILIVTILSVYLVIDREDALAFVYRLVPPSQTSTARLVQSSVARSFGGFLRTQLVMGVVFGLIATIVNIVFGLQYGGVTAVTAGVLHAIPFFGPFLSWLPPVAVALLTAPFPTPLIVLAIMGVGWFLTMNVLQPRLMAGAVGIHPIVVLGSVIIGSKIAGIPGAIFGIPIAAVLSAFFFHWFERSREGASVADRATKRLQAREGHPVRRPKEPVPGEDEDVEEVRQAHRMRNPEPGGSGEAGAGVSGSSSSPAAEVAPPGRTADEPVAPEADPLLAMASGAVTAAEDAEDGA
jgi:predicted PurR-regulated permease PerM